MLGLPIHDADVCRPLAGFRVGVDVRPQAAEVEQPAPGPFRDVRVERTVDRVLDLVLDHPALDRALGDQRPNRNEVIEIFEPDRAGTHDGAVPKAADGRDVGGGLMPEGVGEEDVRGPFDHRCRLLIGEVHAVKRHLGVADYGVDRPCQHGAVEWIDLLLETCAGQEGLADFGDELGDAGIRTDAVVDVVQRPFPIGDPAGIDIQVQFAKHLPILSDFGDQRLGARDDRLTRDLVHVR